jgi:hypothetical protein
VIPLTHGAGFGQEAKKIETAEDAKQAEVLKNLRIRFNGTQA